MTGRRSWTAELPRARDRRGQRPRVVTPSGAITWLHGIGRPRRLIDGSTKNRLLALKQQLAVGGRLVLPVGTEEQWLHVVERTPAGFTDEKREAVRFVPLLPGIA